MEILTRDTFNAVQEANMDTIVNSVLVLRIEDLDLASDGLEISRENIQLMKFSEASWSFHMKFSSGGWNYTTNIYGFPEKMKSGVKMVFKIFQLSGSEEKEKENRKLTFSPKTEGSVYMYLDGRKYLEMRVELIIMTPKVHRASQICYNIAATDALHGHMSDLLKKGILSDFVFKIGRDEFKVHKSVLAAASRVWNRMFTADYEHEEKKTNSSQIDHIEPDTFRALLKFIYCAEIPENFDELVLKLYEAAHHYEIESLKDICLKKLGHDMSTANAVELYHFAYGFELDILPQVWQIIKRDILGKLLSDDIKMPTPEKLDEFLEMKEKLKAILIK